MMEEWTQLLTTTAQFNGPLQVATCMWCDTCVSCLPIEVWIQRIVTFGQPFSAPLLSVTWMWYGTCVMCLPIEVLANI